MADLLNTAVSGLLAFQRTLATTGHNISNVNTPGYSRQQVDLVTRIPQLTGSGYLGSGVNATGVQRVYDQFATEQVRAHTSDGSRMDTYYKLASQVDDLLADPDAGLAPTLQNFFDATQGLADNPSSVPARQVLLSEGDSLVERFHSIDNRLTSLRDANNDKLTSLVNEINSYADSIAKINKNIRTAQDLAGGDPPNDLLDQRDELLRQLAERVSVKTVEQNDGAMNVFIGNGQPLVVGTNAQKLEIAKNEYDGQRYEVATASGSGAGTIVSNYLTGGSIGGVLQFRDEVLDPTRNALGRVAVGLAKSYNDQHKLGLDLNDNPGKKFFSLAGLEGTSITALPDTNNTGTADVTFSIEDATELTTSDYTLKYDGGTWNLYDVDGTLTPMSGSGTSADPFVVDGLSIEVGGGAPVNGDSFSIRPTREAAGDIGVAIANPNDIAAASALRAESPTSPANQGSASVGNVSVSNTDVLPLSGEVTITYASASSSFNASVTPGGWTVTSPLAYDAATNLWTTTVSDGSNTTDVSFELSGTPADGDSFVISNNTGAVADNGNAIALGQLQTKKVLEGESADFQGSYAQMVSDVGSKTHQLDINSKAQKTLLDQAVKNRESISGVNLDEEAANLVKFQQAYQANAQVINAAKALFDTLLDAVRR